MCLKASYLLPIAYFICCMDGMQLILSVHTVFKLVTISAAETV